MVKLEVVAVDTRTFAGHYIIPENRVEYSKTLPEPLRSWVIMHEMGHVEIHRKHGRKGVMRHVWQDLKDGFHFYGNRELKKCLKEWRDIGQTKKEKLLDAVMILIYGITLVFTGGFAQCAGLLHGFIRRRVTLHFKLDEIFFTWFLFGTISGFLLLIARVPLVPFVIQWLCYFIGWLLPRRTIRSKEKS